MRGGCAGSSFASGNRLRPFEKEGGRYEGTLQRVEHFFAQSFATTEIRGRLSVVSGVWGRDK